MSDGIVVESDDVAVRRIGRARVLPLLALTLPLFGITFALFAQSLLPIYFFASVWLVGSGLALRALARTATEPRAGAKRRSSRGRVRVEGGKIFVEAERAHAEFDVDEVSGAWIEEAGSEERVVLALPDETELALRMQPERARTFLEAVGAPARRAVKIRMGAAGLQSRRWLPVSLAVVLAPLTACMAFAPLGALKTAVLEGQWLALVTIFPVSLIPVLLGVLALTFVLSPFVTPKITVGSDGVRLEHWGRTEFFPHASTKVALEGSNIVLHSDGKKRELRATGFDEAQAIVRRIEDARSKGETAFAGDLEPLARKGRPVAEWRAAIVAMLRNESGYREGAPIETGDLVDVIEDPVAPVETRLGAAIGVASAGDADARRRVRIAAESCAEPRLRIALEEAAEGEPSDRSVEKALKALVR